MGNTESKNEEGAGAGGPPSERGSADRRDSNNNRRTVPQPRFATPARSAAHPTARPQYQQADVHILGFFDPKFRDAMWQGFVMSACSLADPARLGQLAAWVRQAPPFEPFRNASLCIYFDERLFGQNFEALALVLLTRETRQSFRNQAEAIRDRSIGRIVTSLRPVWVDGNGAPYRPGMLVQMITLCGVNLMGTGHQNTKTKFLDQLTAQTRPGYQGRNVTTYLLSSPDVFCCEYYILFRRMLYVANDLQQDYLIVPGVGMGIYLSQLRSDPHSDRGKEAAQRLILSALFAAICDAGRDPQHPHCRKIVLSFPDLDANGRSALFNKIVTDVQPRYFDELERSRMSVALSNAEMLSICVALKTAATAAGEQIRIAIVNAGSDATIGGSFQTWTPDKIAERVLPVEELLALTTGFVVDQCADLLTQGLAPGNAEARLRQKYTLKALPDFPAGQSSVALSLAAAPAAVVPPVGYGDSPENWPSTAAPASLASLPSGVRPQVVQRLPAPEPEDDDDADDSNECRVCMAGEKTHLCYPCGHKCLCEDCSCLFGPGVEEETNRICPICRTSLTGPPVKVFAV